MPCPSGHTIYHSMPARLCHIPCHASIGHTIYYAMSARPYLGHAMPARPCHIPCHANQAIPHTRPYHIHAMPARAYLIPCHHSQGHNIYLTMSARSYHIPCHVTANDYFGKACHLSKGANGLVTRCTIACK